MKKRLLSGIRTSGVTHIGNYFGAVRQWVQMQNDYESYAFLADLHALTTPFEPGEVGQKTLETSKLYLALGLDPKKTAIFVQSHVPQHTELAWILGTIAHMGELERQTAFKEKSSSSSLSSINLGLFAYPVLMASDILLYKPEVVPVGEDHKQHGQLPHDLAQRFNNKFGEVFPMPQPVIQKESARIMALDNPEKKMSKSAQSEYNYISLLDDAETIRKKIKSAVTDSGSQIKFDPANKPAISNLITIYGLTSGQDLAEVEREFGGQSYGAFKDALADALIQHLSPIQEKYRNITDQEARNMLKNGAEQASAVAGQTLNEVKEKIGLLQ